VELNDYINLFKRWLWLLILGVALGLIGGYGVTQYVTPVYQSSTKVLIMAAPEESISSTVSQSDQQLAETFTQLLVTRPVLEAVSERLGYWVSSGQVRVQRVQDAQLIQVTVEDSDPEDAAEIANTLVDVFLEQNEQLQANRFASSENSLQAQMQQVEEQMNDLQMQLTQLSEDGIDRHIERVTETIASLQAEIQDLQEELVALEYVDTMVETIDTRGIVTLITPTPTIEEVKEITLKRDRLEELLALRKIYQDIYVSVTLSMSGYQGSSTRSTEQIQAALSLYQQIYANLLSNYESIRLTRLKSTPNVLQVEAAIPPINPVRPKLYQNLAIGGVLGLFASGVIAFLIEFLDDTLRTAEEVSKVLQLPVLGYIGEMHRSGRKKNKDTSPYVIEQPRSAISEAFRSLRANLEFAELDRPITTILITSPDPSIGKTTVAVNLAAIIAQGGKRVILLDADLRRPHIHTELDLPNLNGLSDVLRDHTGISEVIQYGKIKGLGVIVSGRLPPNPAEVLGSGKMATLLDDLKKRADIVIVDAPPFHLADATVLSARVDGVLVVVRPNHTQATAAMAMLDLLKRADARVIGVVLNRTRNKGALYYYRNMKEYSSYSYDYADPENTLGSEKV
jgi:polysaccharide biosynthesis transport protein